eukprot:TRINITY_DN279_c0_g1_i1.p1 TRINITY_DN279_c0_g1~~TRINITY_DN279_c0_g1_i1.p1  ORF type:complete len:201 (+),score=48.04 TRINITY_DN279_c0_g1_i1:90-692(+)
MGGSFLNYTKNQHSLFSIFFVAARDGFDRIGRFFLFFFIAAVNFYFVLLLDPIFAKHKVDQSAEVQTAISGLLVIVVILILIPIKLISRCLLRWIWKSDSWIKKIIWMLIFTAPVAYGLYVQFDILATDLFTRNLKQFLISFSLGLVIEIAELFLIYRFCNCCCSCLMPYFIDDGDVSKDDDSKKGGSADNKYQPVPQQV